MDILYTVEEKYLQAIEELNYGELPKALHYFNEIIELEPAYARAYYQLGSFYYYQFKNYQTAGYYYNKCIELDSAFPDVYQHYLKLLVDLKMHKLLHQVAEKALDIPGVCKAHIYECLGIHAEQEQDLVKAGALYKKALMATVCQTEHSSLEDHLKRIKAKQNADRNMIYTFQE